MAVAAGSGSRPTPSRFSPASGGASRSAARWRSRSINKDAKLERLDDVDRPRPGHADLPGAIKHLGGVRAVLERASARETAARVAAGGLARQLLAAFGIEVAGWVTELGGIELGGRAGTLAELRGAPRLERDLFAPSRTRSRR